MAAGLASVAGQFPGSSLRAAEGGPDAGARAMQIERSNYDRRSKAFGPTPPTGVASYGVGPVGGGGGDANTQQYGDANTGGDSGGGAYLNAAPSEGNAASVLSGDVGRERSLVDANRAMQEQQQQGADQPAPPPPGPQSSIQAMQGDRGMARDRLMQQMQRQQMQRRSFGRGRGPATY
jgi:hypothetical protein